MGALERTPLIRTFYWPPVWALLVPEHFHGTDFIPSDSRDTPQQTRVIPLAECQITRTEDRCGLSLALTDRSTPSQQRIVSRRGLPQHSRQSW